MAKKIAGITIQIDGDTSKFDKELKKSNAEIKKTQSNLRDVNKLLKLDPGNTELLTQKQKYLNDAINETKKKLDIEKQALEQLKNAPQTEETVKQQEALTREIADTENQLAKLEKQYKDFGSVSVQQLVAVGNQTKALGEGITKAGKLIAPVSAATAGLGAAGIAAAKELDEGYDIIIKKTGASGKAFEELKATADSLFSTLPISIEQAGTAVGEINTRFGVTGTELEELSKLFIQFAEINDVDLNNAIGSVDKLMEQFGLDASQTANFLGLLTKKAQETGISTDGLIGSLQSNGAALKEIGFSAEESANLLAQFEANGVNADTALAGLRKSVQAYTKDGLSADEALQQTIASIQTASTETEALAIAQEVFGAKGAAEMTRAIREGRLSIDELSTSTSNYSNVVQTTFEGIQDPWDEWTTSANNAKLAASELGGELLNTLAPILNQVVELIKQFTEWFKNLDDGTKRNIVTVGMLVAALGPLLIVIGQVISAIGTIMTLAPTVSGAIGGITGATTGATAATATATATTAAAGSGLLAFLGPVAAVAGAIAGIIIIWQNWDTIIKGVDQTIAGFKSSWDVFVGGMKTSGADLKQNFANNWEQMKTDVGNAIENMKTSVQNGIDKIKSFFANAHFEFPKIKLPHFSISGKFSLEPPSTPHITVDWYRKAMENGMILNNPTIFGAAGGRLLGGGEAGAEAVVGVNSLRGMVQDAVRSAGVTVGDTILNVYQQPGEDMNAFVDRIMERMDDVYAMQRQAWGTT